MLQSEFGLNRAVSTASIMLPEYTLTDSNSEPLRFTFYENTELYDDTASVLTVSSPPDYYFESSSYPLEVINHSEASGSSAGSINNESTQTQYECSLKNDKSDRPWATLKVFKKSIASTKKLPGFLTGDDISGVLELNLDKPAAIDSITISFRGIITTTISAGGLRHNNGAGLDNTVFIDFPWTIWSRSAGDPRYSFAPGFNNKPFEGKFSGVYIFHFSFPIPGDVDISRGPQKSKVSHNTPIPPSFAEKDMNISVRYELVMRLNHGKWRSDSKLQCPIIYYPKILSGNASAARNRAYSEGALLPGVTVDPEGWFPLTSANIHGRFMGYTAELECTLFLATPLIYTRGSVIPCYISLASLDTRLLDSLANPKVLEARLIRRTKYYQEINRFLVGKDTESVEDVIVFQRAVWWIPPKDVPQDLHERRFEGEIHLEGGLQPSCDCLFFKIEYYVELMPLASVAFHFDGEQNRPLSSFPIKIANFYGPGPKPVAFSEWQHYPKERLNKRDVEPLFDVQTYVS